MVNFTLLVGAQQTNLPVDLVAKMMASAASVQLIRLTKQGKNALDFALAYYLGQAVLADPRGRFHIISGDGGYDSLIEHLRARHIDVQRHNDYATLEFLSASKALPEIGVGTPKPKAAVKKTTPTKPKSPAPKAKPVLLSFAQLERQTLDHLRKISTGRPARQKKLVTHLVDHFHKKTTEPDVQKLIKKWVADGRLKTAEVPNSAENFKITDYQLDNSK